MDFHVSEEDRALRSAVRAISARYGNEYYTKKAEAREFTEELWLELGAHGYIGINVPEEYGGGGAGLCELAAVVEETGAAGCPLLLLLVASAISGEVIAEFGSPEQKAQWLPRLASGQGRVVFAITEPDAGSNAHEISTTARRDGDAWVLNGTKHYISGVDVADAVLVVARTGTDPRTGGAALSLFVVDTDHPGLVAQPLPVSVTLPERQFTLFFDDVRVPADRLIGEEGAGFTQVFHGLNPERVTGAALLVGIGRYALERAADYANQRAVWGTPIGAHQGVAHALAAARIEVEAAALMTARAAWLHDRRQPAGEAANMAKYLAAEAALSALDAAIQCHGGNGVAAEYGLIPLWGLARVLRIAPVNREMILNYVAQHSLGLPRSY
ncbi:acyl-CoA dehydrogenase family protein [Nocardioides daeguensis]|uniref:Acyl-CoA dehydrogenase family protein n=1 Tax=Nocardioides daeguensis TaxID=908359 RepID=A0ABP6UZE4_9ACTN|nr:acyl-CoA dehydrogenase family protein [Nocardioides daeguensis]MBV6728803.1 acyl-CoA/acyl-ACP dehydrogenase [Nocardioides daeguensis]MCR1773587.1 acyl-CoA/acyl-ACP dehydrogenase [Nocardioides daeguensis]